MGQIKSASASQEGSVLSKELRRVNQDNGCQTNKWIKQEIIRRDPSGVQEIGVQSRPEAVKWTSLDWIR